MQPPPDNSARPSSVRTRPDAVPDPPASDDTPTIITINRPRPATTDAIEGLRGRTLGHFELIEPIGVGGMAAVLRATDLQLGRSVALKILPPEMAVDPENITRFKQEARAAAKLDHENIARVYHCGEDQGLHFIAFEFVEGMDLRTLFNRQGPLSPAQAVTYMLQIAAGLAHAASRGVTHRDIKPSNVLITPEGRAKIVDMGLARHADGGVTQSGVTLGTFDYISPEQALEPRNADIRSDIYSLGCTFYHLLTGQPPVPEGTAAKKLHHHQHVNPLDPRQINPAIPDELAAVLARMMAKDPRDRYQRPEQLIQHLLGVARKLGLPVGDAAPGAGMLFVDAPLPRPPQVSPVVVGAVAVAAVAVLIAVLSAVGGPGPAAPSGPLWPNDPVAAAPTDNGAKAPVAPTAEPPGPAAPASDDAPRRCANAAELVELLRQGARHIVLTAPEYDLTRLPGPAEPTFAGDRLTLEPASEMRDRPTIRLAGGTSLVLRGRDGLDRRADLYRLKFVTEPGSEGAPAVAARDLDALAVSDCEFAKADGGAVSVEGGSPGRGTSVQLKGCLFTGGAFAVGASGRARVQAENCAFGPFAACFRFRDDAVRAAPETSPPLATLRHCTLLMGTGAAFQFENGVSGTVRAGNCLFAQGTDASNGEAVLVRQIGRRGAVAFANTEELTPRRNVLHGLTVWTLEPDGFLSGTVRAARIIDARREKLSLLDDGLIEAAGRPWRADRPLALLERGDAAGAFAPRVQAAELRTRAGREPGIVGVQACTWGDAYDRPLPPATEDPGPEAVANRRVVDPSYPPDGMMPANTYRKLEQACAEAKPGDVILIRANGPVEISPIELSRADAKLTIRPDTGFRPLLVPEDVARDNLALFTVYHGQVAFEDLAFRLRPAAAGEPQTQAVVAVKGAGQCAFTRCTATLEEPENVRLSLVTVADPEAVMRMGTEKRTPHVRLSGCFVRGKGDLVAVRTSRRFDLEVEGTLAALDGSLVTVDGNPKDPAAAPAAQVTLRRVTAYLADHLLELAACEPDRKVAGLVGTVVRSDDCLFVAGSGKALIHGAGLDGDAAVRQLVTWEGHANLYGNFGPMVDVQPAGMQMMPPLPVGKSGWAGFSQEVDWPFAKVQFAGRPRPDRSLAKSRPADFKVTKLEDSRRPDADPSDWGAAVDKLPDPGDDN